MAVAERAVVARFGLALPDGLLSFVFLLASPLLAALLQFPIFFFLDLVRLAVWTAYLVYMSGVLNRLPNGKGYMVLGAELGRIACGRIAWWFAILSFLEGDWGSSGESDELSIASLNLIVFAYVFFVFKKSEVKDPQELLTACQGCPCTPLPISPGPAQPQGQVVVH